MTYKLGNVLRLGLPFMGLILLVGSWEIVLLLDKDKRFYLIPGVVVVIREIGSNLSLYLSEGLKTCEEALLGFLLGNTASFALAVWMSYSRSVEKIVYPYAIALKATPIVALAPLIVALFGQELSSKVVCAAVISFFPLMIQSPDALRRIPEELLDLFHALGASERQIFFQLRLPMASPQIFAALKTASSLSIVGALMGEFMSPTGGLGKLLIQALANGWGGQLVAATVVAALVGIAFFSIIHFLQGRVVHWDPQTV
jgi:NitT/TauT family transport system permease protein